MFRQFPRRAEQVFWLLILFGLVLPSGCSQTNERGREQVIFFGVDDRASGVTQGVEFDLRLAPAGGEADQKTGQQVFHESRRKIRFYLQPVC